MSAGSSRAEGTQATGRGALLPQLVCLPRSALVRISRKWSSSAVGARRATRNSASAFRRPLHRGGCLRRRRMDVVQAWLVVKVEGSVYYRRFAPGRRIGCMGFSRAHGLRFVAVGTRKTGTGEEEDGRRRGRPTAAAGCQHGCNQDRVTEPASSQAAIVSRLRRYSSFSETGFQDLSGLNRSMALNWSSVPGPRSFS